MNITVVLVTFNRLNCLKKSLSNFENQELLPKRVVVVNNNSTDGTQEYLDNWKSIESEYKKVVIHMNENIGGAGGFAEGLSQAVQYKDTDWIWLSDDDAYVKNDTLSNLDKVYTEKLYNKNVAALFTSVLNNGNFDLDHRRVTKKKLLGVKFIPCSNNEYKKDYFSIHQGSYVGMLVRREFVELYGITRKDFFIYYDDTEHCERLRKHGELYCVPSSITIHDVNSSTEITWKNYYGSRNSTIMIDNYYGKYYALMNVIKRYIRITFSNNSKNIKKMLRTGLSDGLKNHTGLHQVYKPGWKE